jgi:PAS domain S-box-containing protein
MRNWRTYAALTGSRRVIIGLIISLSLGMVPLTLLLVKNELIERAGETVALGAADIADKLDIVLTERASDIQAFAQSPLLISQNHAEILTYLEELHTIYPLYRRLSLLERDGRLIASTEAPGDGETVVSPSMFQATLRQAGPHFELVHRQGHPGGSLRAVRFSARLHDQNRHIQGAIVSEIDQNMIRQFVTQTTRREQASSWHPEIQEFAVLSPTGEILLASEEQPDETPSVRPASLTSAMRAHQGKTGYVEEVDRVSGRNALTGYARMAGPKDAPDFQWSILVRVDRAAVLQSIWTVLWKLVGVGEICLVPLLGLFYWARHRQSVEESQSALARRALEANEARIRKIVDIALDAVVTIDDRGLVTGWNPQAEQIFGWKSGEVIGQSLTNTIGPPRYREAHERGIRHYAQTGTGSVLNKRIEITALDRTGREFPIELSITPMHLDGKTIFSAFLRDITERKQAEDELRRAQTVAESASRAKTEFLANMSHELRTPLNAIVGTSDLLLKTSLTSEQRQCALMSQRSSQALLRLVNDVLDLAKIEAGTVRVESAPFDLAELLERTKRLMELRQLRKNVALAFTVAPDVPTQLEGDGLRLQQILFNLLGNALKFTDEGSVSLTVSRATTDAHRPLLRFTVSDTGIGIPADHLEHIFDRFTQVDSGDNRKYGGTGLGLSICKQLVQLMQGTIQVTSEMGKGSTFTVTLPFSTTTAAAVERPPQATCDTPPAAARAHSEAWPSAPLRLLLVDDSPEIGQLTALYLKGLPYQLDRATDGPSAIQQFQTHRYDLIFMDLQMPGMDGYATATAIRAWEDAQGISRKPIIALTADVLGPAKERSRQAGCTGFVGKPFLQATFLEAIQQYARPVADRTAPEQAAQMPPASEQPDEQNLDRLRRKFLHNRRRDLAALASAMAARDWTTIHTLGHRMKGLAGSYGFEDIGVIGTVLEQAADGQELDRVASGMRELTQILERLDPSQEQAA